MLEKNSLRGRNLEMDVKVSTYAINLRKSIEKAKTTGKESEFRSVSTGKLHNGQVVKFLKFLHHFFA
jgi:hypothetical protein